MSEFDSLEDAIRNLHVCESTSKESVPIVERFQGTTVWEGVVEVFNLTGHLTAKRCYAWKHKVENGRGRFIAMLKIPPIDSAGVLCKRQSLLKHAIGAIYDPKKGIADSL